MVAKWLDEVVAPGDVFYDVGAGIGTYSLTAAIKRGALAIAFEPGFAVYRTLCENVRMNDAAHSVIPLPFALPTSTGSSSWNSRERAAAIITSCAIVSGDPGARRTPAVRDTRYAPSDSTIW